MKKARCTARPFHILRLPTTPSPSWEKTAHEGQVLGHFPSAPRRFDSEQLGSRAAYVEAAGFEATDAPIRMAARVSLRDVCRYHRDNRGNCRRRRTRRPPYRRSISSRRLSSRCRSGWINRFASAMGRPPCSGTIFVAISNALEYRVRYSSTSKSKGGHPPTASIVRTGAAATLESARHRGNRRYNRRRESSR